MRGQRRGSWVAGGNGYEIGPTQFCPKGLPSSDLSAQQGSGQETAVLGGRVSTPAGSGGMGDGHDKALGGEPEAGNRIGAWSPQAEFIRVQDLPSLFYRLARPWLRYLTPGAQSHMPGNPTLLGHSPQLPAATSKQDFSGGESRSPERSSREATSGKRAAQEKALHQQG